MLAGNPKKHHYTCVLSNYETHYLRAAIGFFLRLKAPA